MSVMTQQFLFGHHPQPTAPFKKQLLKWVGNKQRFAHEIISFFPISYGTYFEPFIGSGAVLGTLAPQKAVASDVFAPLIGLWQTLVKDPATVKNWYRQRWERVAGLDKVTGYEAIKASYNGSPNPGDLLFLCRACYGGVVRFRKADGYISTPCGVHSPVSPASFDDRADEWHKRVRKTQFICEDFESVMERAAPGDMVYCDPPYVDSQTILYGAQAFSLERLFAVILRCKQRGVRVALSIDGTKQSGGKLCDARIPTTLFNREVFVNCGRSMLRRFQLSGKTLEGEVVHDRLLLTY